MTTRIHLTLLMVLGLAGRAVAAEQLDFATVDRLSYRYFMEKQWDSVIHIGTRALHQDIDYYFLRIRLGIAYYEKKNYFRSVTHLERAKRFNSADTLATEYLYWAYIRTGQEGKAHRIAKKIPAGPGTRLAEERPGLLRDVYALGGYTLSSNRNPGKKSLFSGTDSIYGEEDLYGNNWLASAGLTLEPVSGLTVSFDYSFLQFDKTRNIEWGRAEAELDTIVDNFFSRDYFYRYPWRMHDTSFTYRVSQHEVHLGLTWLLPEDLRVSPAVHLIRTGYPVMTVQRTDSLSDTAYYLKTDSTWHLFRYPAVSYFFNFHDTTFTNWVISLDIARRSGRFDLGIGGSWSNLNGMKQWQAAGRATYYPLGSSTLYATAALTVLLQDSGNRLLPRGALGGKILPRLWAEADFIYGDLTHANMFNGSVVYNNSDMIRFRAGAVLTLTLWKHLSVSAVWQYFSRESRQLYYAKNEDPVSHSVTEVPQIKTNPYHTQNFLIGILWKP